MAKKNYSRFTILEREILFKRLAEGKSQKDIATELRRDPSTISREIQRGGMNKTSYRPSQAEEHAKCEAVKRKRKYKLHEKKELAKFIEDKLKEKWSPEQISGSIKKLFPDNPEIHVSHETIYRYIYSVEDKQHRAVLIEYLRQGRRYRKPRKRKGSKDSRIKDLVSIQYRPEEVEDRQEPGHWEGDLVIGKDHKSAIGTLVERTTRYTIIVSFEEYPNATRTALAFAAALGVLPSHMKKSLTYDRGTEMAGHKRFTEISGVPVYFADAYSPWQRGTNENTNGLIRDYFPKKTDFRQVDDLELLEVQSALNSRPRKLLEFSPPEEMFDWFEKNPGTLADDYFASRYSVAL